MHTIEHTSPSEVSHPFNQPSADVILRTSDAVDFLIHTTVLSLASPVFATMFQMPQPPPDTHASQGTTQGAPPRPVVDIAEDSRTLDPLLRLCYPMKKAELHEPERIQRVLEAAIKYDMEWPVEVLTKAALACARSHPLQVWAMGCRLRLENVARRGAEAFMESIPEDDREELLYIPQTAWTSGGLEGISAGQYFRLLAFVRSEKGVEVVGGLTFERLGALKSAEVTWKESAIDLVDAPPSGWYKRQFDRSSLDQLSRMGAFRSLPFADDGFQSIA